MTKKPGWIRHLAEQQSRYTPDRIRLMQQVADAAAHKHSADPDAADWNDEREGLREFILEARALERESRTRFKDLVEHVNNLDGSFSDHYITLADTEHKTAESHRERAEAAMQALRLIGTIGESTLNNVAATIPRRSDLPPLGSEPNTQANFQHDQSGQWPWHFGAPIDPWAFNPFTITTPWTPPPMMFAPPFMPPVPPFAFPFMHQMPMMPMMPPPMWPFHPFGMAGIF